VRCWFGWLEETQQLFLNPAATRPGASHHHYGWR